MSNLNDYYRESVFILEVVITLTNSTNPLTNKLTQQIY